ncbi:NAC domain-containing protein 83-like [Abrus precatorius]|uniref:NAC domain-containing protein 83-like n=1 Tax=Abrus precatorius TaxID=3816 RepID=A0A8B8L9G7_ABRPR|nr:NAC domain-containing protein 83-like [Abrus precatorius]
MEKLISYGIDGNIKLPVGYRFHPTDDVLVSYYLTKKVFAQPFPSQLIPDYDVFQTQPSELPGGGKSFYEQKFFFYHTGTRVFENPDKRVVGSGQWRVVEKGMDVELAGNNEFIGKKNTLVFWEGKGTRFSKTNWVMHEFQLAPTSNPSEMSVWGVYRIFQKKEAKRGKKAKGSRGEASNSRNVEMVDESVVNVTPSVIDFTMETGSFSGPPSPLSP